MSVLTCYHILLQVELSKEELQHIIAEAKEQLGLVEFLDDLLDVTLFVWRASENNTDLTESMRPKLLFKPSQYRK